MLSSGSFSFVTSITVCFAGSGNTFGSLAACVAELRLGKKKCATGLHARTSSTNFASSSAYIDINTTGSMP